MLDIYLLETFGYNEPIFINDLSIENTSDNALRQAVKRLVACGFLKRYDTGIYYIPKAQKLLENSYLDPLLVIVRKYIKNTSDTYGYMTGATFANQLGLTTQMPATLEIATNKESTKGRVVTIGGQTVRLKRAPLPVTENNVLVLQLLDGISQVEKYCELDKSEMISRLKQYIRQNKFTQKQLSEVAASLTGSTAKKLIEWGMIYEFTS